MKKSLLVLATIVAGAIAADAQVYLRGGMNGWDASADWMFSTEDDVTYVLSNVEIADSVQFKIADANWAVIDYGCKTPAVLGEWKALDFQGGNMMINYADQTPAPVDVYFNLDKKMMNIVFAGTTPVPLPDSIPEPEPEPDPNAGLIFLRGGMNGWDASADWMFSTEDDVTYVLSNVEIADSVQFKIADANWAVIDYGCKTPAVLGEWKALDFQGGNMMINYADQTPAPVDVYFNLDKKMMNIVFAGITPVPLPDSIPEPEPDPNAGLIFLRGGMNSWGCDDAWKFTTEDNVSYSLTGVHIDEDEMFKIADSEWALNLGLDGNMIEPNTVTTLIPDGSSIKINFNGSVPETLDLFLNLTDQTLLVSYELSGVGSVATDNAAPVYYTIQGVHVNNPKAGGFYIVKTGDKVVKTIVR